MVEIVAKSLSGAKDDEGEDTSGYAWQEVLDICDGLARVQVDSLLRSGFIVSEGEIDFGRDNYKLICSAQ